MAQKNAWLPLFYPYLMQLEWKNLVERIKKNNFAFRYAIHVATHEFRNNKLTKYYETRHSSRELSLRGV